MSAVFRLSQTVEIRHAGTISAPGSVVFDLAGCTNRFLSIAFNLPSANISVFLEGSNDQVTWAAIPAFLPKAGKYRFFNVEDGFRFLRVTVDFPSPGQSCEITLFGDDCQRVPPSQTETMYLASTQTCPP